MIVGELESVRPLDAVELGAGQTWSDLVATCSGEDARSLGTQPYPVSIQHSGTVAPD
jgi:hypothetical protein